jgi:quinoprotein relay system zinc metallohydrolase 2
VRSCSSDPLSTIVTRRTAIIAAAASAFARSAPAAGASTELREIAPGIFVRRGADTEATRANAAAIGNAGFVIGRDAVCVTDPGGSMADGAALRSAIRARTDRPITHVVLGHGHPDHVFGAAAFVRDGPAIVGHHRLAASLASRGDYDRQRLSALIGAEAAGPWTLPNAIVRDQLTVDLGMRRLTFTAHSPAHTRCDLSLIDDATGILFAGDLLFVERIPSLDGSLTGWIAVLDRFNATRVIPGHGPVLVDRAPAVAKLRAYLVMLRDQTRAAIARGVPIDVAARTLGQSARANWRLFDAYHPGNVIKAYKELEWE